MQLLKVVRKMGWILLLVFKKGDRIKANKKEFNKTKVYIEKKIKQQLKLQDSKRK